MTASKSDKKENPSFYAVIPAFVRYNKDLSPNAKLLYGEITTLTNKKGYCFASNNYFANVYGVDKSSITHWIKQLADAGYIRQEFIYAEGKPNITERRLYIIDLKPSDDTQDHGIVCQDSLESEEGGGDIIHQGGEKTHRGVVKNFNGGGEKTPEILLQANNTRATTTDQSSPKIEKPPPEEVVAAFLDESIDELKLHFSGLNRNLVFGEAFYPKVLSFLSENGLDFDYLSWMYNFCAPKASKNLSGYLFRVLCEPCYIELYREASRPPRVKTIICPVCGKAFTASELSCPDCGFRKEGFLNEEEVREAKLLRSMEPEKRKAYEDEYEKLRSEFILIGIGGVDSMQGKERASRIKALKQKYGLLN